ncbi:MAG: hypothetical protein EOR68_02875 [Mesorhizobium sp.]|uniref:hypothetical protein n=1 Tax=Mesorhizobium sp. TaxID=1871066 RepID=UPI000FE5C070|nr:hypothetical protein [Mesorhizobium sp.]RWM04571.1 MAG: hypothetical protein EOR68_02875 [Mesorhizobium sp.]
MVDAPSPLDFFARLKWLDGKPLLDVMEDYRREFMMRALYTFRDDGVPLFNLVLSGRGKKNWKSCDLVLAGFYRLLLWKSIQGNDVLIAANDEGQAGDDLGLAKKLVECNPILGRELGIVQKQIRRRDGRGVMTILPSRDAAGLHGKTALMVGFDEIHGYRDWDILEALAPDPTRPDTLTWVTSYDTIYNSPGVPLYDMKAQALRGEDERLLFSWYSADLCTDPAFADLPAEQRANPSMSSWPDGMAYLDQQRRRLPTHKYRRLHLNLPGAPDGAFFDGGLVDAAFVRGVTELRPEAGIQYQAWVDMSGGSNDDAVLAISHKDTGGRVVLDHISSQHGKAPFNPREAVAKFARTLRQYGLQKVTGDAYAGETFVHDFAEHGIRYRKSDLKSATEIYEQFEPMLNAGDVELLDAPLLQKQMLSLVVRGARITHQPGDHDDWANAACGACILSKDAPAAGSAWSHSKDRTPTVNLGHSNMKAKTNRYGGPVSRPGYGPPPWRDERMN